MPSISTSTAPSPQLTNTTNTSNNNAEIEEALARIRSHKGVEGILVMTKEGM